MLANVVKSHLKKLVMDFSLLHSLEPLPNLGGQGSMHVHSFHLAWFWPQKMSPGSVRVVAHPEVITETRSNRYELVENNVVSDRPGKQYNESQKDDNRDMNQLCHEASPNTVYLAGRAPMPGGVGAASAVLSKPY